MRKAVITASGFLFAAVNAQPAFQVFFGDSSRNEKAMAVEATADGFIYVAGFGDEDAIGGNDVMLAKFDSTGAMRWKKFFGTAADDFAISMAQAEKNHFIICGSTGGYSASQDALLIKTDSSGNLVWQKPTGDSLRNESFEEIAAAVDGSFIATGFATAVSGTGNDFFYAHYDSSGSADWVRTFGTALNDYSNAAIITSDGNFMISGDVQQQDFSYRILTLKLNENGDTLWSRYNGQFNAGCQSMIENSNGNYLVCGESATQYNPAYQAILFELDSASGALQWFRYWGTAEAEAAFDITEVNDSLLLATGYGFNETTQQTDIFLSQLDASGNELRRDFYGAAWYDIAYDIDNGTNGKFLIAGAVHVGSDFQYALICDTLKPVMPAEIIGNNSIGAFAVCPNPSNGIVVLKMPAGILPAQAEIELCDLSGNLVDRRCVKDAEEEFELAPGIYILAISTAHYTVSGKIVVLHGDGH